MGSDFEALFVRRLLEFPYLPSPLSVVDAALDMVEVRPWEVFADLGCGDGRVLVRAAEKFGVYCVGFELDPRMALLARDRVRRAGVGSLVDVICADIFTIDLSRLNVVYVYPFPTVIDRLSEKIVAECSRGTRVLVHDYMLRGLSPVRSVMVPDGEFHVHWVYLYVLGES